MAAPEYVPRPKSEQVRTYASPPRRAEPWTADRPGEVAEGQPVGPRLGHQGPDQGFAIKLARRFEDRLVLAEGEHEADVLAGCVGVALKRASMFGRAPTIHDLTVAFTIWGFLDQAPPPLVAMRRPFFAEVRHPNHYLQMRRLVDKVPAWSLQLGPDEVRRLVAGDPQAPFALRATGDQPVG